MEAHFQNESMGAAKVKLTLSLKTMDFTVVASASEEREVLPFTAVKLAAADYTDLLTQEQKTSRIPARKVGTDGRYARDEVFVEAVFEVTDEHGERHVQYESEVLLPYKYMKLKKPTIRTAVTEADKYYEITLTSDVYAPFIMMDFADADVIFADNCINLTGQEPRTIRLEKTDILNGAFENAQDLGKRLKLSSLHDTYVE